MSEGKSALEVPVCWCGRGPLAPRSASVRFGSSPLTGPEVADRARAMRGREGMVYAGATPSPRKRVALHLAPPMSSLRFWPTSYDIWTYDWTGAVRTVLRKRVAGSQSAIAAPRRTAAPRQGEVQAADSGKALESRQSVVYGF